MFTVIYHGDAGKELAEMPAAIQGKLLRLVDKLESDARALREPDTKPLGNGLFEIRSQGSNIARGLWVYQEGRKIYMLRFFIKKTDKTPKSEIELALSRLEEMKNDKV